MAVSLCPISQGVCDTIMSPLVFLIEFQELFTLDCEETTSEENNATTTQVKTGWHHPLVSWLYRNKCGSPSMWYTLTLLSTFHIWPGLLEAWLVLTSVKYHGNLYNLIPLNQRLALTRLRATGPWLSRKAFLLFVFQNVIYIPPWLSS